MTEYLSDCRLKGDLMGLELLLVKQQQLLRKEEECMSESVLGCLGIWGADKSDFASVLF